MLDTGYMMTVCQMQLIWRKMPQYVLCVGLLKLPNCSMSLATYFIALFVLFYGDCWELWAAFQHVEALGDIGYYKSIRAVDITYHSSSADCSRVSDFY